MEHLFCNKENDWGFHAFVKWEVSFVLSLYQTQVLFVTKFWLWVTFNTDLKIKVDSLLTCFLTSARWSSLPHIPNILVLSRACCWAERLIFFMLVSAWLVGWLLACLQTENLISNIDTRWLTILIANIDYRWLFILPNDTTHLKTPYITSRSRGGPGGPGPPLTPRFGCPSYTIWRPSVQFKG